MRKFLWPIILVVSLVAFAGVVFAADSAAPPTQAQNLTMLWPMVGVMLATVAGWALPKLSSAYSFFHTAIGAIVIGAIGAAITSVIPIFQAGTVTWVALAWAAIGGVTAFFSRLNPSTTADDPPAKSPAARPGAVANPPPPVRPGLFLPFAFVALALSFSACAHLTPDEKAFGTAYGACMEARGLAVAPSIAGTVWNDLNNGTNQATVVAQLEALAAQAGQAGVSCAVQAWLGSPTKAEKNPAGVAAGNAYLKAHAS